MSPRIGVIVTGEAALKELRIFMKTLEVWHPDAELYIATDKETNMESLKWKGTIHVKQSLDRYVGKRRYELDSMPGVKYNSMWTEYMYEKVNVIEWMLESPTKEGAWFFDADISFLAPLPAIPTTASVALSPHYIKEADTKQYGYYNAGFMWFKDARYLRDWRNAGFKSRYYEQAALEDVANLAKQKNELYEFPIQVNFGWWRMFQMKEDPPTVQTKFSLFRKDKSVGIRYDGQPLQSVHTHWYESQHSYQSIFNGWFKTFLKKFASHPPIKVFSSAILS